MNRAFLTALFALALSAQVNGALAADKPLPSGLSSIPEANVPEMLHPRDAPSDIRAGERMEGVAVADTSSRIGEVRFLSVTGLEGRCVTLGAPPPGDAVAGTGTAGIRASVGALPLRAERLVVRGPGEASLEVVDGWIDVGTSATRQTSKTIVPLTVLAKGPNGYEVYGFRKGEMMHIVLASEERFAFVDPTGSFGFTNCGHVRLKLDSSQRAGSMMLAMGRIKVGSGAKKLVAPSLAHPVDNEPNAVPVAPPATRAIRISASTSRTNRDREPIVSVSVGWAEEEAGVNSATFGMNPLMPEPLPQVVPEEIID